MNIDEPKLRKVIEALGWLQQAERHYRWLQHQIGDDCVKKAKAALEDKCFKRQPIFANSREVPPTIKIKSSSPLGFAWINSEDFDPKVHLLWEEPAATKQGKSK